MFGLHAIWLVQSIGSASTSTTSQCLLFLAIVFFALKTIDLASLRFRCTRRALISALLVVVLLHVGAIDRALESEMGLSPWMLPVLASTAIACKLCRSTIIRRLAVRLALTLGHILSTWTRTFWHLRAGVLIRRHQHFLRALCSPRAPPA